MSIQSMSIVCVPVHSGVLAHGIRRMPTMIVEGVSGTTSLMTPCCTPSMKKVTDSGRHSIV